MCGLLGREPSRLMNFNTELRQWVGLSSSSGEHTLRARQHDPDFSNKNYGNWGSIFGDPIIAPAILDRLLHHSTTINIRGESYRLREPRKAGLFSRAEEEARTSPSADTLQNGP